MWCRAVLGLCGGGPLVSGWALLASLAAGCQCCYRAAFGGAGWLAAALSSCIMHDHVNGGWVVGLLAPPTWPLPPLPTPDRQGHSPRYDRTRNLNGFTQRRGKKKIKEGAGGNFLSRGPLGAGRGRKKSLGHL